jgi:hypothetical protein
MKLLSSEKLISSSRDFLCSFIPVGETGSGFSFILFRIDKKAYRQ